MRATSLCGLAIKQWRQTKWHGLESIQSGLYAPLPDYTARRCVDHDEFRLSPSGQPGWAEPSRGLPAGSRSVLGATTAWWPVHAADQSHDARTITGDFASLPLHVPSFHVNVDLPPSPVPDAILIRISLHLAQSSLRSPPVVSITTTFSSSDTVWQQLPSINYLKKIRIDFDFQWLVFKSNNLLQWWNCLRHQI